MPLGQIGPKLRRDQMALEPEAARWFYSLTVLGVWVGEGGHLMLAMELA